jgi:hypothetical protein
MALYQKLFSTKNDETSGPLEFRSQQAMAASGPHVLSAPVDFWSSLDYPVRNLGTQI